MSQSGRLTLNQPVPGAGIETITGNAGGPVPGDGAGNIDIVGAGTITVTGVPGTNTLTISSTGLPATYTTDNGAAVPNAFGDLTIIGDPNITTDALIPNTVRINLDPNIAIAGTFTAGSHITSTGGNIVADIGNITATAGTIEAGNQIIGTGGGVFYDTVAITAGGLDSTGPTVLNSLNRGVVQVDAVHTLFSNEGIDGQVLIGSGVGPVAWRTLTAGANVAIANGHNSITIGTTGALSSTFHTDAGNAVPAAGILNIVGGTNINTSGVLNSVTVNLDDDIGVAGTITAGGNIATTNGNITASIGDIVATNGDLVANNGTMFSSNAIISDNISLLSQPDGVLVTDGAGLVTAQNGNPTGTNGQVLISGPGAPAWGAITSTGGTVTITNPLPNNINLEVTPADIGFGPTAFKMVQTVDYTAADFASTLGQFNAPLSTAAINNGFDGHPTGSYCYLGNGTTQASRYTAPADGLYSFTLAATFDHANVASFTTIILKFLLYDIGGIVISSLGCDVNPYLMRSLGGIGNNYWFGSVTHTMYCTTGQWVTPAIQVITGGVAVSLKAVYYTGYGTYFSGVRIG